MAKVVGGYCLCFSGKKIPIPKLRKGNLQRKGLLSVIPGGGSNKIKPAPRACRNCFLPLGRSSSPRVRKQFRPFGLSFICGEGGIIFNDPQGGFK